MDRPDQPPHPGPPPREPVFWPIALWLAVQMAALMLAALHVPLSARYPAPEENLSVHLLVIIQIVTAAMLFPWLLGGPLRFILVVATAMPFIQLAAFLATETDNLRLVLTALYVVGWLAALAVLNQVLPTTNLKMQGVALGLVLSLGGAMVAYLEREFAAAGMQVEWTSHASLGPIMGCIAILESGGRAGTVWYFLGSFLSATAIAAAMRIWGAKLRHRWKRKRQLIH